MMPVVATTLAVLAPLEPIDELVDAARAVAREAGADVEVVVTPYVEPLELRSARGRAGGANPGLSTPEIDDATLATWADVEVVVALDVPDELERVLPRLAWIQSISAGWDSLDVGAFAERGVRLTTASGIGANAIAEFAIARLLQDVKLLGRLERQQRERTWEQAFGGELTGRTLGVIGLGAIGRQVARRARAFEMEVLATRASARPGDTDPDVDELLPADRLDDVLARCDAVVSALPSNPATADLFDAGRFAAMPAGSWFCNVGRGAHVVEADLIAALESGHLRGAAVDVTRVEPLPADDPLWSAPNLAISPHCSVSLDRYVTNLAALTATNLERYLRPDGGELVNEVDLAGRGGTPGR